MGTTTTAFGQALAKKPKVGSPCSISVVLDQLDDETRAEAIAALADPTVQHVQIRNAMLAVGHELGDSAIGRHRNGQCKCER